MVNKKVFPLFKYTLFALCVFAPVVIDTINCMCLIFYESVPGFINTLTFLFRICIFSFFLFTFLDSKKNTIIIIFLLSFFIILVFLSYLATPEIKIFFPRELLYPVQSILVIVFLWKTNVDCKKIIQAIHPYIFLSIIYTLLKIILFRKTHEYSMFGYLIAIPAMLCLLNKNKNGLNWFFCIFLLIGQMYCGSRGFFLCIILAIVMYFFIKLSLKKQILWFFLSILCIFFALLCFSIITAILLSYFPDSRTIQLLSTGNIFILSGREDFYSVIINEMKISSFSFHGIFSDRIYIASYFNIYELAFIRGCYTHNIILEILFDFGLLGIVCLFLLFKCTIKGMYICKKTHDDNFKTLFIVSFAYCYGQLFISSSYLIDLSFSFFLGICLFAIKNKGLLLGKIKSYP